MAMPLALANAKASQYYEDALQRFEKKDTAGAIIQLKNALRQDKNLLPVHVLLGRALMASGAVPAAEVAFNDALRLGVNRSEVVLLLGRALTMQGKQQELVESETFRLAGLPNAVQAQLLLQKAGAYSDLGDAKQALKSVEEARALDPTQADTWLAEVPIRIRARQLPEAVAAVEKARALVPGDAEMHYQDGSVQHVLGQPAAALAAYGKALAALPGHTDSLVARAGLLLDLKRDTEAAKDVQQLLQKSPTEPRGWYLSAMLAERAGRSAAARASLAKITELLDPIPIPFVRFRPQLLLLNGQAHYALGQREKAKPYFEAFQRTQPGSPVSKVLANILLSEGNFDAAINALDTYLRANPNDAQAMALLASGHMAKGRHARAATLMQDALRRKDAPELYAAYGLSLMGLGQTANAIPQLETAYRKDPSQTQAAFALVGLYLRSKQPAKALSLAQTLAKAAPANPSFHNLVGMAKAANRDVAGARAAYEQALKLDASLVPASLNLARLEAGANNLPRAESLLAGVLKLEEKNTEAMVELAALAERVGRKDEALRWLGKGTDVAGASDLRPGLALVDAHQRAGRKAEALKVAQQLAALAPESLPVLLALARTQLATGDSAAARTSLGHATRLAGFNAGVQVELALLQLAARNVAGAAYSLDKALSDKPDHLPALALMSEVELRQNELAKAEQRALQIVKREPKLGVGHGLLGDIAVARRQPAQALEHYRKAYQVEPSLDTLTRLVGVLAAQDPKLAVPMVEAWVKARPKDSGGISMLAELQVRAGNLPAAKLEYERLRALRPKDAGVLNNLANVLVRLQDPQAMAVAEQALAADPDNVIMIDTAGWVAFKSGQGDRALQLLRNARLRDPNSAEIRYHLAAALAASGRKAEAKAELEVALASKAALEHRADAERLLATLR